MFGTTVPYGGVERFGSAGIKYRVFGGTQPAV